MPRRKKRKKGGVEAAAPEVRKEKEIVLGSEAEEALHGGLSAARFRGRKEANVVREAIGEKPVSG